MPERLVEVASRLPKTDNYWDTKVRDAFAVLANSGLANAQASAEKVTGPSREQALAGVAESWARNDFKGALAWAKGLPGVDPDGSSKRQQLGSRG